ncbi:glucose-1-phosphate cytidylyltransferase [Deinococcus frigens]|uniref:glucose-1-phosphate cytidylyltransferase n=1 Tax=Deinococcus frigens TaxID=249403 RepID=UPI000495CC1E|nr:glucose-1-phosphate cytidylyltransferase [Deinococcus frigens]
MKAVIFAGGLGTRISEESVVRPKPMIEIGGRPILWHILKMYSAHGITDFVVLCGYKQYMIKEYFNNYFLHMSDVTFDMRNNEARYHRRSAEPWCVTLVDTGEDTMTGGRLARVRKHLQGGPFCLTYGDGVSDVDIAATIAFHREHGRLATMTVVQPPGRFGAVTVDEEGGVSSFQEKPDGDGAWINGGFSVLEPEAIDYIEGDGTTWEAEPLRELARAGQLAAYRHAGFWQPMDTLRDRNLLEELWRSGQAPWKVW